LLFQQNSGSNVFPLRMVAMETDVALAFPAQAMFVVPKRNFKKSPDRNKLKRRMREAYRLSKSGFYKVLEQAGRKVVLAFIYTGRKQESYSVIEASLKKLLQQAEKSGKAIQ
jgi:ribonuclease P protein component